MSEVKHNLGPLTVRVSDTFPFNIETLNSHGVLVFSDRLPCHSSNDKTKNDAINCVNYRYDERNECAELNRRAIADSVIRAAALELLSALERAERKLAAYIGVCSGDKELTKCILPMARSAISRATGSVS